MLGSSYTLLMAAVVLGRKELLLKSSMCSRILAYEGTVYMALRESQPVGPSRMRVCVFWLSAVTCLERGMRHMFVMGQRQPLRTASSETTILAVRSS